MHTVEKTANIMTSNGLIGQSESSTPVSRIIKRSCMFSLANQQTLPLSSFEDGFLFRVSSHYPVLSVIHNYIQSVVSWNMADCEKVWWRAEGHCEYYRVCDLLGWRLPAGLGEMTQFSFRQVIEFQHKSKALYLPREWSLFVAGCAHRGRSNQGREGWWGWALTRKHFIRYSPLFLLILCPLRPLFPSSPLFSRFEGWRWQRPWAFSYSGLIRSVIQDTHIFSQGMCYSLLAVYKKRAGTATIVDRTKEFRWAPWRALLFTMPHISLVSRAKVCLGIMSPVKTFQVSVFTTEMAQHIITDAKDKQCQYRMQTMLHSAIWNLIEILLKLQHQMWCGIDHFNLRK